MRNRKKLIKKALLVLLIGFVLMNVVAFFHAYKFTHFAASELHKTKSPETLGTIDKVKTLLFGVNNPRPENKQNPGEPFETIELESNKTIECWMIKSNSAHSDSNSLGTVILFHGYSGEKSTMLERAKAFRNLGYSTFLVDFMGSGGSEGNQTTIGFKEAEEVKTAYDYISENYENNIYLFGNSMGAAAILKAQHDYNIEPKGIILECPFGSMYETTCARFRMMKAPTFPMAGMLVFWGGVQNNFWAFNHNPAEYSKSITTPTLLFYGALDQKVSRQEIDLIYNNLQGHKLLRTYDYAGHENFYKDTKKDWIEEVKKFLNTN
jgi:uncharacterized protein